MAEVFTLLSRSTLTSESASPAMVQIPSPLSFLVVSVVAHYGSEDSWRVVIEDSDDGSIWHERVVLAGEGSLSPFGQITPADTISEMYIDYPRTFLRVVPVVSGSVNIEITGTVG